MTIIDSFGDEITAIPDDGMCKRTGENPAYMDDCPTDEFDGDCCPEMCEYYTEDKYESDFAMD